MTEDTLMWEIARACRDLHLLSYHTFDSRRSARGFPDWVIVGRAGFGVLYRECKTERGRVTRPQAAWLAALCEAGADAAVWRPIDWYSGRIAAELAALVKGGRR